MTTFTPHTDAVGQSVALTALLGLTPLVVFFILLALVKLKAHVAGLASLGVALLVAIFAMDMPAPLALLSATQGAIFGAFPVFWIVVMAVWLYQITVLSGRFNDLRLIFNKVGGGDIRIQAVLIAFCFGGLLEALAGFGAPIAITATMLMALGLKPLKAATTVLIANTAPVAFGAIAIPITTAGNLTGLSSEHIGAIVGRQAPLLAIVVPLILILIIDGVRGVKETWAPALVTGLAFAIAQFLCANYFSYELTDIVAALVGMGVAVLFLRFWRSEKTRAQAEDAQRRLVPADHPAASVKESETLTLNRTLMALMPYGLVIVIFGAAKLWTLGINIPKALTSTDAKIPWPGLDGNILKADGTASTSTIYLFPWLSNPGTLLLITGLLVALIYSVANDSGRYALKFTDALKEIPKTLFTLRNAGFTIISVLALAYVMNFSGQTIAIGTWLAATGGFFAFLSPILGWVGTAVTGSDTSANALFAKLQQTAAHGAGIDPNLLVAANTTGGVVGKLISPQNLAIAATSVGMHNKESEILKTVVGWSVGMLIFLCTLVYLQSTPILGWMLP